MNRLHSPRRDRARVPRPLPQLTPQLTPQPAPQASGAGARGLLGGPASLVRRLARLPAVLPIVLAGLSCSMPAQADGLTRNWGEDPFLQLRADDPRCPEPRGPRMTAAEWRAEAHWRIETGTSCWLAGRCADANAYRYDRAIAQALFPRLQALPELAGGSLWAYLQRRILFVQGCVADSAQAQAVEAAIGRAAAASPDLQMIVPALRMGSDPGTPYRRLDAP